MAQNELQEFQTKLVKITAAQWFKNGDHPHDNCRMINPPGGGDPFLSEGKVVRRYRHPSSHGKTVTCEHCGQIMHVHGWIDTVQGGHDVCPGDWIITEMDGKGYYPCKPKVFAAKYERAGEQEERGSPQTGKERP